MNIKEMIIESLNHIHAPNGKIVWQNIDDEHSTQHTRCVCGVEMVRHTAPPGAKYNWQDWEVSK